jgi:hypothetical protein
LRNIKFLQQNTGHLRKVKNRKELILNEINLLNRLSANDGTPMEQKMFLLMNVLKDLLPEDARHKFHVLKKPSRRRETGGSTCPKKKRRHILRKFLPVLKDMVVPIPVAVTSARRTRADTIITMVLSKSCNLNARKALFPEDYLPWQLKSQRT